MKLFKPKNSKVNIIKEIIGKRIAGFTFGKDEKKDDHIYYIVLENGIKIGIARVKDGKEIAVDRGEVLEDGTRLLFRFILPKKFQ